MLFRIDYTRREAKQKGNRYVNHVADQTEAVSHFMDWFFRTHPNDGVRLDGCTAIEFTGDLSVLNVIDAQLEAQTEEPNGK